MTSDLGGLPLTVPSAATLFPGKSGQAIGNDVVVEVEAPRPVVPAETSSIIIDRLASQILTKRGPPGTRHGDQNLHICRSSI